MSSSGFQVLFQEAALTAQTSLWYKLTRLNVTSLETTYYSTSRIRSYPPKSVAFNPFFKQLLAFLLHSYKYKINKLGSILVRDSSPAEPSSRYHAAGKPEAQSHSQWLWHCSLGSSPGSAFSRVQVTGVSFKCINIKFKQPWTGLRSFSRTVKLYIVLLKTSTAKELSTSVFCLVQGNTQTHPWQK